MYIYIHIFNAVFFNKWYFTTVTCFLTNLVYPFAIAKNVDTILNIVCKIIAAYIHVYALYWTKFNIHMNFKWVNKSFRPLCSGCIQKKSLSPSKRSESRRLPTIRFIFAFVQNALQPAICRPFRFVPILLSRTSLGRPTEQWLANSGTTILPAIRSWADRRDRRQTGSSRNIKEFNVHIKGDR